MSTDLTPRELALSIIKTQNVEIWSQGKVDLIPQIYREEFVGHFPGLVVRGHDEIRNLILSHRTAFPDWSEKIEDVVFEHDKIAIRFTSTGTNLGPNFGRPATNRSVKISELSIYRIVESKIAEQWVNPEIQSLTQQLYGDAE